MYGTVQLFTVLHTGIHELCSFVHFSTVEHSILRKVPVSKILYETGPAKYRPEKVNSVLRYSTTVLVVQCVLISVRVSDFQFPSIDRR